MRTCGRRRRAPSFRGGLGRPSPGVPPLAPVPRNRIFTARSMRLTPPGERGGPPERVPSSGSRGAGIRPQLRDPSLGQRRPVGDLGDQRAETDDMWPAIVTGIWAAFLVLDLFKLSSGRSPISRSRTRSADLRREGILGRGPRPGGRGDHIRPGPVDRDDDEQEMGFGTTEPNEFRAALSTLVAFVSVGSLPPLPSRPRATTIANRSSGSWTDGSRRRGC